MKTRLDGLRLSILAALGLPLACAGRAGMAGSSDSGEGTGSGTADSGEGEVGEVGDDEAEGEGEGDWTGTKPDFQYPSWECEGAQPIFQAGTDVPSGFVQCADGFIHRVEAVECLAPQGPDSELCPQDMFGCASAADCVDQPHGSCIADDWGGCLCHYGCVSDADCTEGTICACAGVVSDRATCIPAECTSDEACAGGLCGLSVYDGCCGQSFMLACAADDGPCHVDAECGVQACSGQPMDFQCTAQSEDDPNKEGWSCEPPGWCSCDCGRAFFVDEVARIADPVDRADWTRPFSTAELPAPIRARLAAHWSEVARFEHASVASFARFCLQLLHLGAPPALLVDTQRALADEIEHARICFGLASRYAGQPIGPGPLTVAGALEAALDTRAIVEGLVVEACVGETLAAVEVQEAALCAEDPEVAAALRRIAADELRHARLGWRALQWILDQAQPELRRHAARVFESAMRAVASDVAPRGIGRELRAHGLLDDALRNEVRRKALESLVVPCAAGLTGPAAGRATGRAGSASGLA